MNTVIKSTDRTDESSKKLAIFMFFLFVPILFWLSSCDIYILDSNFQVFVLMLSLLICIFTSYRNLNKITLYAAHFAIASLINLLIVSISLKHAFYKPLTIHISTSSYVYIIYFLMYITYEPTNDESIDNSSLDDPFKFIAALCFWSLLYSLTIDKLLELFLDYSQPTLDLINSTII